MTRVNLVPPEAIAINKQRIIDRIAMKPTWYRWSAPRRRPNWAPL